MIALIPTIKSVILHQVGESPTYNQVQKLAKDVESSLRYTSNLNHQVPMGQLVHKINSIETQVANLSINDSSRSRSRSNHSNKRSSTPPFHNHSRSNSSVRNQDPLLLIFAVLTSVDLILVLRREVVVVLDFTDSQTNFLSSIILLSIDLPRHIIGVILLTKTIFAKVIALIVADLAIFLENTGKGIISKQKLKIPNISLNLKRPTRTKFNHDKEQYFAQPLPIIRSAKL